MGRKNGRNLRENGRGAIPLPDGKNAMMYKMNNIKDVQYVQ